MNIIVTQPNTAQMSIGLKLRGRLVCDFKSKDANLITTPLQNHTTIQDPQKKGLKLETMEPKRME